MASSKGFKIQTREKAVQIFKFIKINGILDTQQQLLECSAATMNLFEKIIVPGRGRHHVRGNKSFHLNLVKFMGSPQVADLFKTKNTKGEF